MSFAEIIEPIVDDIVERQIQQIPALSPSLGATCMKVGDASLFNTLGSIPDPWCLVQYAGEDAQDPENMGTNPVIQQEWVRFQLWLGAKSFSTRALTANQPGGVIGLNTLVDATWFAISGYLSPSARSQGGSWSKFFHVSTTPPEVTESRVVSIMTFKTLLVRQGNA